MSVNVGIGQRLAVPDYEYTTWFHRLNNITLTIDNAIPIIPVVETLSLKITVPKITVIIMVKTDHIVPVIERDCLWYIAGSHSRVPIK
jgi:hypothetical protein